MHGLKIRILRSLLDRGQTTYKLSCRFGKSRSRTAIFLQDLEKSGFVVRYGATWQITDAGEKALLRCSS